MRDPDGSLSFEGATVVRRLREPLDDRHFLRSTLAQRWIASGHLVKFEVRDAHTVVAERLPFVTYPNEWSDAQLCSAAQLTLQLQREAEAEGFDLKDASAWNIVFVGTRPIFCDLLSFVPLTRRKWWAAGQFARHFVLPLALAGGRGLHGYQTFQIWRDGIPSDVARGLFGPSRFLTRYWPLMAKAKATPGVDLQATRQQDEATRDVIASFRAGLGATLAWMLKGATPKAMKAGTSAQGWEAYADRRDHYLEQGVAVKRQRVSEWLARLLPQWVADFGCNTGEFSRLASAHGASVVAVDADHDSVERMFRMEPASPRLFPVVATLDDLSGGRGWAAAEYAGLAQRLEGRFDVVMMLALIHHLAVAASVPLSSVAAFAARCTRRWLIVELISEADPQMQLLCAQRLRSSDDFSMERQRAAFLAAGFVVEDECSLAPAARSLLLLRLAR